MFRTASELMSYRLSAQDRKIGRTADLYFDDEHWAVRYLVADTGSWLTGRQVIISPWSVALVDDAAQLIHLRLSRRDVENSPSISEHEPVSRHHEREYHNYYRVPKYWSGPFMWGPAAYPGTVEPWMPETESAPEHEHHQDEPHLRSVKEVTGYYFRAQDGDIGHVEEFLIDEPHWAIRYLVVDTVNWWPGKKVLISPEWVTSIDWSDRLLYVNVSRDTIRTAPEYTSDTSVTRQYENALFTHYQQAPYWNRSAEPVR